MTHDKPRDGDLLISRRSVDGRYEISIVPGPPQVSTDLLKDAVAQAIAFAGTKGTSVWIVKDGVPRRVAAEQAT